MQTIEYTEWVANVWRLNAQRIKDEEDSQLCPDGVTRYKDYVDKLKGIGRTPLSLDCLWELHALSDEE